MGKTGEGNFEAALRFYDRFLDLFVMLADKPKAGQSLSLIRLMTSSILFALVLLVASFSVYAKPSIPDIDRVRIAEAFRIGEKLQDQIWTDWHTAPFAMLFVTDDQEFLIRHKKPNDEFTSIGYDKLLGSEVYVRPRKFAKNLLATFPAFDGTPVIVVGKAENTADKTSTRWVFVVLHEHFHQLQQSRPNFFEDVAGLNLAHGDETGMWQLNYAFPYRVKTVAENFRHLADLLIAASGAKNDAQRQGSLAEYLAARKAFAASLSADDYKYASFQLWQEGIARYTQYKIADLAGWKLKPSKAFRALPDFTPFDKEAKRLLAVIAEEMKEIDLPEFQRVAFYPFGASEGLLLDKVNANWRRRYFKEKFALEKFYPAMEAK